MIGLRDKRMDLDVVNFSDRKYINVLRLHRQSKRAFTADSNTAAKNINCFTSAVPLRLSHRNLRSRLLTNLSLFLSFIPYVKSLSR